MDVISTMNQLKNFVENPPSGPSVIINAHSEPLPIPASYLNESGGLSGVSDVIRNWHIKIKNLVSKQWVWAQPTGYPFLEAIYYISPNYYSLFSRLCYFLLLLFGIFHHYLVALVFFLFRVCLEDFCSTPFEIP